MNASELLATGVGGGFRDVFENGVKHRPGRLRQISAKFFEFAVNVGEEEERFIVQRQEAGIMYGADSILRFGKIGHQRWQLFRQLPLRRRVT